MEYAIGAMVLATVNVDEMVTFYSEVFGIEFTAEEVSGHHIHSGKFSGLDFALVPAALMELESPKNPTHYDIFVSDLEEGIARVERSGGRTNGQLGEDDHVRAIGIFDPDDNFMVFKQRKAPPAD